MAGTQSTLLSMRGIIWHSMSWLSRVVEVDVLESGMLCQNNTINLKTFRVGKTKPVISHTLQLLQVTTLAFWQVLRPTHFEMEHSYEFTQHQKLEQV